MTPLDLELKRILHPGKNGRLVPFFGNWQSAIKHIRDHLLTKPECHAWALIAPHLKNMVDPSDDNARWRFAHEISSFRLDSLMPIYDLYHQAASEDLMDALALNWTASDPTVTVAFGTSGIILIFESALKTAYIPGQGDPRITLEARRGNQQQSHVLPRERGMRSPSELSKNRTKHKEIERQKRRELKWSSEQRIYYRAFRPALQNIKKMHHRARDLYGRLLRNDAALLKSVLPAIKRIPFPKWASIRSSCRRS